MQKTVHIIGAGVSGLSAAVRLANANYRVHVHEATQQAGGRCRSYFDGATNLTIDNGNHLLLSGNRHALNYARSIGTEAGLVGPKRAQFPFVDLATGQRWTLDLGSSRLPTWVFDEKRRVPDTSLWIISRWRRWCGQAPTGWSATRSPATARCTSAWCSRYCWRRSTSIRPRARPGLPARSCGKRCSPAARPAVRLIARDGLSSVLIEPAVKLLQDKGSTVRFSHELRRFVIASDRVSELNFGDDTITVSPDDAVVLAVPPRAAASLLPGLKTPNKFRAIVNAHFRFDPPKDAPPILGVVGGLVEWLFAFPQRLSVTISNGDRLVDMPREELAQAIWQDVCKAAGIEGELPPPLPPWQIVRERRATFEATPEQNALRPGAMTAVKNLFLAGDWTDTGLPATIEGSVRSGDRAADLVLARRQV